MSSFVYTVIQYGCNSTPSDMWTPLVRVFKSYSAAYEHFLRVAPSLDEKWGATNKAKIERPSDQVGILEYICQVGYDEDRNCAKRPSGAVIARCAVE
jgi:hypothetical protein